MFSDKQFNVVAKVDKYGKKINKKDEYALQNYYQKDSESGSDGSDGSDDQSSEEEQPKKEKKVEQSESSEDDIGKKYYDSDGKFDWVDQSSSSSESEDSEGKKDSDEEQSVYSDNVSGVWSLDEEEADENEAAAEEVEVGKRIAVTNLDWDSIGAVDLYALFNSFCAGRQDKM